MEKYQLFDKNLFPGVLSLLSLLAFTCTMFSVYKAHTSCVGWRSFETVILKVCM